jgi:hypothetical protein
MCQLKQKDKTEENTQLESGQKSERALLTWEQCGRLHAGSGISS